MAPGSASLVARFTTDNANKGDQYYVAAWPGRYTSPPPKVVDGRCTLGEQLRPKNCTLPGNPPVRAVAGMFGCVYATRDSILLVMTLHLVRSHCEKSS